MSLIATTLSPGMPEVLAQKSSTAKRNLKVDVKYDKKKDVTRLHLEPLTIWEGGFGVPGDKMHMHVAFEYPKRRIVKPQEVLVEFVGGSGGDWQPFPNANFAARVDGVRIELGAFEGGPGALMRTVPLGGVVYESRGHKVSFENFGKIATANKLTLVIGDHDYVISKEHLQALNDFYQLMQQEGRQLN